MSFDYADRQVWLDDLDPTAMPAGSYALCDTHADRLTPPVGWTLSDRRGRVRPLFVSLEVA